MSNKELKKLKGVYKCAERGLKLDPTRKSTYYLKNIFPKFMEGK